VQLKKPAKSAIFSKMTKHDIVFACVKIARTSSVWVWQFIICIQTAQ